MLGVTTDLSSFDKGEKNRTVGGCGERTGATLARDQSANRAVVSEYRGDGCKSVVVNRVCSKTLGRRLGGDQRSLWLCTTAREEVTYIV